MGLRLGGGDHVVPTLGVDRGIFSGLDIYRHVVESSETLGENCGDCLVSMDILGYFFGYYLGDGK